MRRAGSVLAMWLLALMLSACGGTNAQTEPVPLTDTPPPSETPLPTPTQTVYRGLCAYVWSDQHLPQASLRLLQALQAAGLDRVEVSVSAYGETCVDSGTNEVVSFAPQTTNYTLVVLVTDTAERQVMGDMLAQMITIIEEFHTTENLGGHLGQFEVQFQDGAAVAIFSFPLEQGIDLVKQGLRGGTLLNRLQP